MAFIGAVPPEETIRRWRKRGSRLLTSYAWQDVSAAQHRAAFTVAKAAQADVLALLSGEVDRAIAGGTTFEAFAARLEPRLTKAGWWGKARMPDPLTGKRGLVQLGSMSRLRTIFHSNLAASYAQGQWDQIQRVKEARPYLRYVAIQDRRTRPDHAEWHGVILPVDDPFWRTHYPPNGWRCRCLVQQLSGDDLDDEGWAVSKRPRIARRPWTNKRTGERRLVPDGIDPGWDHNVGLVAPDATPAAALGQKLLRLPAPIARAVASNLAHPVARAWAAGGDIRGALLGYAPRAMAMKNLDDQRIPGPARAGLARLSAAALHYHVKREKGADKLRSRHPDVGEEQIRDVSRALEDGELIYDTKHGSLVALVARAPEPGYWHYAFNATGRAADVGVRTIYPVDEAGAAVVRRRGVALRGPAGG